MQTVERAQVAEAQAFLSRTWAPGRRWHPGLLGLAAAPSLASGSEAEARLVLVRDGGEVVGMGWMDGVSSEPDAETWVELVTDPGHSGRADAARTLVEWAEETSDADAQGAIVGADEDDVARALREAGFVDAATEPALEGLPVFETLVLDLQGHEDVAPEDAAAHAGADGPVWLRSVTPDEAPERSEAHERAWAVLPGLGDSGAGDGSRAKDDSDAGDVALGHAGSAYDHAHVIAAPGYRGELDWVAVDATGRMLGSALVWLDERTGAALLEPVGVLPEARGRGLGRAVSLAALMAARRAGARTASVETRRDAAYPAAGRLYRSLGFAPAGESLTLVRSL